MRRETKVNWYAMLSVWNRRSTNGATYAEALFPNFSRLVDEITYKKASEATDVATQSAILGPFFRHDHPIREKGATISFNTPKDAVPVYIFGQVLDAKTKKPLANATIDVWEASTNGRLPENSMP